MDKDVELTSFLLRHLRDNGYFKSKQAMATEFEMSKRILQRLMNTPEQLKGGSLALGKVLHYFGEHAIPLDDILMKYFSSSTQSPDLPPSETNDTPAYMNITLMSPKKSAHTTDPAFAYCQHFICLLSQYICPTCTHWCDPWENGNDLTKQDCMIGHTAKRITETILTKDVIPDAPHRSI